MQWSDSVYGMYWVVPRHVPKRATGWPRSGYPMSSFVLRRGPNRHVVQVASRSTDSAGRRTCSPEPTHQHEHMLTASGVRGGMVGDEPSGRGRSKVKAISVDEGVFELMVSAISRLSLRTKRFESLGSVVSTALTEFDHVPPSCIQMLPAANTSGGSV